MFLIYCFSHVMMFWVARHSGWNQLATVYKASGGGDESPSRMPGKLVLGDAAFGVDTAAVCGADNEILIRLRHVNFFMTFLHFPDLAIPKDRIAGEIKDGAWIECPDNGKVFFRLIQSEIPEHSLE